MKTSPAQHSTAASHAVRRQAPARFAGHLRCAALLAALAVVLAATPLLAACGEDTSASPPGSTASLVPSASPVASTPAGAELLSETQQTWLADKGTLQVGAFNDYPPFSWVDDGGTLQGIAVDYWQLLAERLGAQVAFTPVLFSEQIDGLKSGRFDSLTGIFPLPERKQWFDFSRPYYVIDTRIFTDAQHRDATTLKALKGLKVAVVKDDSSQQIADKAGLDTLVVAGYPQAVKAVADGKAQAMVLDEPVAEYYIAQFGVGDQVKAVGDPVDSGLMTLPVKKGQTELLGILDTGIGLVSDAEFQGIYRKYVSAGE